MKSYTSLGAKILGPFFPRFRLPGLATRPPAPAHPSRTAQNAPMCAGDPDPRLAAVVGVVNLVKILARVIDDIHTW